MEMQETDNLTAWEELSGRPSRPSVNLDMLRQRLEEATRRAEPCPPQEAMRLLGVNLVLCSPSGMSEADRVEWLKAALMTIGDCPRDILEEACVAARKVCDHPAKIVPFICKHVGDIPDRRRKAVEHARDQLENAGKPRLERKPEPELDQTGLAADIGALARELERKARIAGDL